MPVHDKTLDTLIEELKKLPGLGTRSAERLAYHILYADRDEVMKLAAAIRDVKEKIRKCSLCFMLADSDPCHICRNTGRDPSRICVVEKTMDVYAIEKTAQFKGFYHVLGGLINPLEDTGPEKLTLASLLEKAAGGAVKEIILALSPTVEGDATSLYITENIDVKDIQFTRLARGLPAGGSIEYASKTMLIDALKGRTVLGKD